MPCECHGIEFDQSKDASKAAFVWIGRNRDWTSRRNSMQIVKTTNTGTAKLKDCRPNQKA